MPANEKEPWVFSMTRIHTLALACLFILPAARPSDAMLQSHPHPVFWFAHGMLVGGLCGLSPYMLEWLVKRFSR